MTSTIGSGGRLGNQMIRNLAVSQIAKKNNLFVNYSYYETIISLGIELFVGEKSYNSLLHLHDDNYFTILQEENINCNLNANWNFFQTKEITNFLCTCLHESKEKIIERNPYKERYNNNNDCYIHLRLGDIAERHPDYIPGIPYLLKAIECFEYENIYISTETPEHKIIQDLIQLFPNIKDIDATNMRKYILENNKEKFMNYLPKNLTKIYVNKIWNIVKKK